MDFAFPVKANASVGLAEEMVYNTTISVRVRVKLSGGVCNSNFGLRYDMRLIKPTAFHGGRQTDES